MNRITFHVLLLLLVLAWSCEQEGDISISRPEPTPSTANEASSSSIQQASASRKAKNKALNELNYSFKYKFYPIKLEQVEGLSSRQFEELIDGSKINFIKKEIQPVLSANGAKYLLLRKVRLQKTGKLANVALISVPEELHEKFKPVIAIVSPPGNITKRPKACFSRVSIPSRQLKTSDPKTLCITYVKFISDYDYCPPDECVGESPDSEPPVSEAIAKLVDED